MNPNYTHDFSSASIKHQIEAEFYQKVGECLSKSTSSATIVTGPDYQRHIDNFKQYIGDKKLRICEIDPMIYTDIKRGTQSENKYKLYVENKSIEFYGSAFIDCDLTCISDIDVIRKALLKQIDVQSSSGHNKAFIFSFSIRGSEGGSENFSKLTRNIFGLLGANVLGVADTKLTRKNKISTSFNLYRNEVKFTMCKGRIKEYKCYSYNAGGGPMLTCLLIYK